MARGGGGGGGGGRTSMVGGTSFWIVWIVWPFVFVFGFVVGGRDIVGVVGVVVPFVEPQLTQRRFSRRVHVFLGGRTWAYLCNFYITLAIFLRLQIENASHPPNLAKMAQQDTTGDVPYSLLNQEEGNAPAAAPATSIQSIAPTPRRSHPFILYLVPFAVVTLCASLYYLYYEAQLSPITSCRNDLCTVLVVVDMQNDYCLECNSTTVSPWAVSC